MHSTDRNDPVNFCPVCEAALLRLVPNGRELAVQVEHELEPPEGYNLLRNEGKMYLLRRI